MMHRPLLRRTKSCSRGYLLLSVLLFSSIAALILGGLIGWAITELHVAQRTFEREQSIHIAEAGIDYYRWHLAHAPTDFQDGTGGPGPYVHEFRDKNNNVIGHYSLSITPPPTGSTLVTIVSSGSTTRVGAVERNIEVQFAKPSIAKYAVVANDVMRFGQGTVIFGPVHSNQGIRFDGLAHNLITSSVASYDDPDHEGGNEFGVHTHVAPVDPLPPAAVPARPDVFRVGREFPVPVVDFGGITADLAAIRSKAQALGFYRAHSGSLGYRVRFKTDGNFDLFRVTAYTNPPANCTNSGQDGWGTWSIGASNLLGTYPIPSSGLMFFEDHVFVDGQISGKRVTLVAATLPDNVLTRRNIIVNNDLRYSSYDGSDVIGLIAQQNILVGMVSEDDLRVDAALIAQNGFVGRYYYRPPGGGQQRCSPYHVRYQLTLLGMIGTNRRYGFAYTDGTGYAIRNLNYDGFLLYGPPPDFPLDSDEYVTLKWVEVE